MNFHGNAGSAMMQDTIYKTLQASRVQFIRILWCDNANIIRGKAIHIGALSQLVDYGVGISAAQQAVPVMHDAVVAETGLSPVGEIRLIPDWNTLSVLPYSTGHARAIGDMMQDGIPWAYCPRDFLKRAIAAAQEAGIEVMAAFENEFYLLHPAENGLGVEPGDRTVFASTFAMDANLAVINEIAEALLAQNIPVEQYHPESGGGQHEISVRYTRALSAADYQIAFRETVRAVALRHKLKASFLPKIFAEQAGSGCHLHLSLWQDGKNLISDTGNAPGISKIARAFIAGILEHLPALMALTTPSINSYRRIRPHSWSGAFRTWGYDNREAAIRVPSDPASPSPTQIEIKTVDASANPYIALGAVITAGLDGVRRQLEPKEAIPVDPGSMSQSERAAKGIDALPTNLGEAIANLQTDKVLLDALGKELAQAYIAVRLAEWEAMKDWALKEEVKLLLERY
ncbi:glutamine synthetase family protein [Chroococcidiopsis sp. CCNUC1]|uniref:glutamine synthetase family protein n=1 Tax=Chroococcidiopsis sp. CCNUC1 TaxID=2653189 RepID=UPI002020636E|nr:glutamine synthetase family protein [Chroococcidiopsis sp. CCNUC1]URD52162.1 glutamine synthetase family protein [Chroococcidiopsis sp. CCNUC1]